MNGERIDAQDLKEMLRIAGRRIEEEESSLNELDAAVGDGDHGITMRIGFEAIQATLDAVPPEAKLSDVLKEAGKVFMGGTGGAIGVIFGRMLIGGGNALMGVNEIGPAEVKTLLDAMEASVVKAGKAQPGDKTLLDALHAACESLNAPPPCAGLAEAFSRAADGAEEGARSTADMLCRLGRGSRFGDRVIGHRDPGAVSFSLVLRSMADWVGAKGGAIAAEA